MARGIGAGRGAKFGVPRPSGVPPMFETAQYGAPGAAMEQMSVAELLPLLNPFWGLLPMDLWGATKDFFVYSVDFLPLTASVVSQAGDIQIQADSHFMIMAGVREVRDTTNATVIAAPPELVRILDAGSGRELNNQELPIDNLFGTAQLPSYWPYPKIIKASSTLTTFLTNLEATDRNARISYLGFKIFPRF